MDSDQEVTREPFENDDNYEPESERGSEIDSGKEGLDSIDGREPDGGDRDDDSSRNSQDDVEYAKKFGIDLKSSKIQSAYERLISSNSFKSTSPKGHKIEESNPVIPTSATSDCIYHKGTFYQKGDIVALCDQEDGRVYFAQIKGFLQDQFCEKSAALNWLVPNRPTSRETFDPSAYEIGLEDNQLRKLDCMTFVRHCPHDYYVKKFFHQPELIPSCSNASDNLEPTYSKKMRDQAYVWTSMGPCKVPEFGHNEEPPNSS